MRAVAYLGPGGDYPLLKLSEFGPSSRNPTNRWFQGAFFTSIALVLTALPSLLTEAEYGTQAYLDRPNSAVASMSTGAPEPQIPHCFSTP